MCLGTGEEHTSEPEDEDENIEQARTTREKCGGREIPVTYTLPNFGFQINLELSKRKPVSVAVRGAIAKKLFEDMLLYCTDL